MLVDVDVNAEVTVNARPRRRQIEELDALLEGRLAPEDASADTRRLATMATSVLEHQPLPAVELAADRKAAMRQQLLADIAELPAPALERAREALVPRFRRAATQARVAVASTMAASMVGTTGVAVAAQEALPGDALYGIKKATESLRLSLAGDPVANGRLELRFAQERLDEVVVGSQDQRVASADDLIGALAEMDERSLTGAELLIQVAERDGRDDLLREVADFTERQAEGLALAYDRLPTAVKPHAEDSLSVLRRIRIELLLPAIDRCDCVELAGSSTPISDAADEQDAPWFRSAALPLPPLELGRDTGEDDGALRDRLDDATGGLDATIDEPGTSDGGTRTSIPSLTGSLDSVGQTVDDTVSKVVEDTTDTVDGVAEDTTGTVGKVIEDTTDTVDKVAEGDLGGAVDDVVEDTTGTIGKVIEDTTGTVGEVVEDTTGTVGDLVDDTTTGLGGLLGGG